MSATWCWLRIAAALPASAERASRMAGHHGLSRHHPLERHHRDVLCGRVHTAQDDSELIAAGRAALL